MFKFTLKDGLEITSGDTLFTLDPFDEVYVRFSPEYQKQQVVKVNGEIMFAGSYALPHKNTRLSDHPGSLCKRSQPKTKTQRRRDQTGRNSFTIKQFQ